MKVFLAIFVFVGFGSVALGQELKKVTKNNRFPCYSGREVFYVLKSNPEIRHGAYTNSLPGLVEKGQYDHGKKAGAWEFSTPMGVVQIIDFSADKLVYNKPSEGVLKAWILDDNGNVLKETDVKPIFIGGDTKLYINMLNCIRYPRQAQESNIQGKVLVSAVITKDGKMIDEKVDSGPGFGLNEEALRVYKMIPDEWLPYVIDGKAVNVKIQMNISFHLSS